MGNNPQSQLCCSRWKSNKCDEGTKGKGKKEEPNAAPPPKLAGSPPPSQEPVSPPAQAQAMKPELSERMQRDREVVMAIRALVPKIATSCKKFPRTGMAGSFWNKGAKQRYVAAVDADSSTSEKSWHARLYRWKAGTLTYWADETAFKNKKEPKGSIQLMNITKVHSDDNAPKLVTVRHAQGSDSFNLVFAFEDELKANAWRKALHSLRGLLESGG